ncbi:MAG: FAD:protein FMN transferase [Proteobacteria bacterium]|nr:FAD:protein FMN transferase [Pseudomonadota bacterium]MCH7833754.1 FAD:protein FMN transferase [Pseudomonadota bacterium]
MAMRQYDFSFEAMACVNELSLYASNKRQATAVAKKAIDAINKLESRYSRYLPDSLLTRINESAGDTRGVAVDEETAALLNYSQTCFEQSDGMFDITSGVLRRIWNFRENKLPTDSEVADTLQLIGWDKVIWDESRIVLPLTGMELDFGGVVKEYAADTCATLCRDMGVRHGLINMGGDIHVIGPHPDGSPWKIGIQSPDDPGSIATTVNLKHGGLASSGDYQRSIVIDGKRYGHILNPKTGWPVEGLRAVSVVAPQCLIAGSTSTIAMLKGEAGKRWLDEVGLPYLWFDESSRLFIKDDCSMREAS